MILNFVTFRGWSRDWPQIDWTITAGNIYIIYTLLAKNTTSIVFPVKKKDLNYK